VSSHAHTPGDATPDDIERLAEIAAALIAFPTVADDGDALDRCLTWAVEHVRSRAPDLRIQRYHSGGKPSALLWHGDIPPRVLLAGHLDVVAASGPDAFTPRRGERGRLYGRGAADMKGPVAALLDLLATERLPGLGSLLTGDEESGGEHGALHVLERMETLPEVVVLPDGGANMRLICEQKGVLRLALSTRGEAAHGSRPWLGASAIERLYAGYEELRRRFPVPTGEDDWRTSVTLTSLRSEGNSPNTVPQAASGILDIRYPAGDSPSPASATTTAAALANEIAAILRPFHTATQALLSGPAFRLDERSPWVALLQAAARRELGHELPLAREAGASDARFFAARGVPILIFQPDCANWHSHDEWVALPSLVRFRSVCARFVHEALA
jgi:succinyl-diaminopimelate desuccinylase